MFKVNQEMFRKKELNIIILEIVGNYKARSSIHKNQKHNKN